MTRLRLLFRIFNSFHFFHSLSCIPKHVSFSIFPFLLLSLFGRHHWYAKLTSILWIFQPSQIRVVVISIFSLKFNLASSVTNFLTSFTDPGVILLVIFITYATPIGTVEFANVKNHFGNITDKNWTSIFIPLSLPLIHVPWLLLSVSHRLLFNMFSDCVKSCLKFNNWMKNLFH